MAQHNSSSEIKRGDIARHKQPCTMEIDIHPTIDEVYPRLRIILHIIKHPIVEPLLSATSALSALFPHSPPSALRHFALLEKNFAPLSQFYE